MGKLRRDLKKYITHSDIYGYTKGKTVAIPVIDIDLPRFRYGKAGSGGVGQGDGNVGDPLGDPDPDIWNFGPGNAPGEHIPEVEITLDELAEILGAELSLPRIQPRGRNLLEAPVHKYRSISRVGPSSLLHFKRSYREALKRQCLLNAYNFKAPLVVIQRPDRRYREWVTKEMPQNNAVILYGMDVSGSMGEVEKDIVRHTAFWIDLWLKHHYPGLVRRFFLHDTRCIEVTEDEFYRTHAGGGTNISAYLKTIHELIVREYPVSDWNIYPIYCSDGDNWGEDNPKCIELLTSDILPEVNVFLYLQVRKSTSGKSFYDILHEKFKTEDNGNVAYAMATSRGDILDAIRTLLGRNAS